jgi:hypothetical protein
MTTCINVPARPRRRRARRLMSFVSEALRRVLSMVGVRRTVRGEASKLRLNFLYIKPVRGDSR